MKIPNKLKIGAHIYKVKYEDLDERAGNNNLGTTYPHGNKIFINKRNVAISQQEQTLFHEILETLNFIYELKLEHEKISIIAEGFYQVLKDNNLLNQSPTN